MVKKKSKEITDAEKKEAEEQIIIEKTPVSYDTREYTVQTIVEMFKSKEWIVPRYQREFVWKKEKQSRFIESVLLDLPIPYLYLADEPQTGKLEILDGSQRIRTLNAFVNNKLKLEGLQKLKKINGFFYDDLLETRKRRFGRKTIRSIELTETVFNASWLVRKDLFDRINTEPYALTPMQIRKGLIDEHFYNFLNNNSRSDLFKKLAPISDEKRQKEDGAEMVLRYFAYSSDYKNFIHKVIEFIDKYLYEKLENYDIDEMQTDFNNMLNFVEKYFPAGFKKKTTDKSTYRVRYEAIAVGTRLALNIKPNLKPKSVTNWIDSPEFEKHTRSDASNNRLKVIARIEYVRDKLLEK